jgi:hypothetical protein
MPPPTPLSAEEKMASMMDDARSGLDIVKEATSKK